MQSKWGYLTPQTLCHEATEGALDMPGVEDFSGHYGLEGDSRTSKA